MSEIVKHLLAEAEKGDPDAMFALGWMYLKGDGVEEDKAKARRLWEKAAEKGLPEAMFNLGLMYAKGVGVKEDKAKAREWWEKAAEKGLPEAMFSLGVMYYTGGGVEVDKAKAWEWLEKAAEKGLPEAMFNLGLMYDEGDGVRVNKQEARRWLEKAAEKGLPEAMLNLGLMYAKGDGVDVDKAKARRWWKKAAEKGLPKAMLSLGLMYAEGDGVKEDKAKACRWWKKAAVSGYVLAGIFLRIDESCPGTRLTSRLYDLFVQIENLVQAIEDWKGKHIYKGDKPVVHYTRIPALRSLMQEKRFRLYNIHYVNDPSEGASLVEYSRKRKREKKHGFRLHEFFEQDERARKTLPVMYIASFSVGTEMEDNLGLWCAYGSNGEGVSLVIPPAVFKGTTKELIGGEAYVLERIGSSSYSSGIGRGEPGGESARREAPPELTLYKVIYKDKEKEELLESLNEPLEEILSMAEEVKGEPCKEEIYEAVRMILGDVLYLCKNEKYASEREVRLVTAHLPDDKRVLRDDETGRLYVETAEFLFKTDGYKIVLGPRVDYGTAALEVNWWWSRAECYGRPEIRPSVVPYR